MAETHSPAADEVPVAERVFEPHSQAARNARIGLVLFAVYLLFYAAFMLLNTFRPELMDAVPAAGVNLAIWYGFALIAAALILALMYAWLCRRRSDTPAQPEDRP
jgi:uncharacterized membrane protein (DUF485 family)